MRILILGIDGYIGWPLALHLLDKGHSVAGLDSYVRRQRVKAVGSDSLTPIATRTDRELILRQSNLFIDRIASVSLDVSQDILNAILREIKPDAIVHLAEQPSAPWSMIGAEGATRTQHQNVIGTLRLLWAMKEICPDAHLVKLGTMGEYGTPSCDIPEGEIPEACIAGHESDFRRYKKCSMKGLPFPRSPGSFYHLSKVHDTHNIIFACKTWELTSTDIMQGVVFGLNEKRIIQSLGLHRKNDEQLLTRFDYDEYFGTVINRFCTQAIIGHPLTVYGKGDQRRGFLPLKDSLQCITLILEKPPKKGEYRTFNQFEYVYTINSLAEMVCYAGNGLGTNVGIKHIDNPRVELESHYYEPAHQKLFDLGYKPTMDIQREITDLIRTILPYKDRVTKDVILPTTEWR